MNTTTNNNVASTAAMNDINEKIKQAQQQQQQQQQQHPHPPQNQEPYEIRDPYGILELMRSRL